MLPYVLGSVLIALVGLIFGANSALGVFLGVAPFCLVATFTRRTHSYEPTIFERRRDEFQKALDSIPAHERIHWGGNAEYDALVLRKALERVRKKVTAEDSKV